MARLAIGLVYDLLGSYPRRPGDPPDVDAEYEPEATLVALEAAVHRLGHRPLRIGSPHDCEPRECRRRAPQGPRPRPAGVDGP